ncbi:MAG: hypothetical protein U0414_22660 [Polyangiaceae bacterium]
MNFVLAAKAARVPLALLAAALAALVTTSSCSIGGSVPTIDCTTTTVKTYAELKGSVMAYCTDCHGSTRADRGVRYDTYAAAVSFADQGAQTIADGSMPTDFDIPESAAQDFYAWSQCGTPE